MEKIINIASEILGEDSDIKSSMENKPEWDSLKTLQIVMALDEAGYDIPVEKIADIRSMKDIIELALLRA